jgi:hypothetical protein
MRTSPRSDVQQKLDDDDMIQNQEAFEGENIGDVRCATKVLTIRHRTKGLLEGENISEVRCATKA